MGLFSQIPKTISSMLSSTIGAHKFHIRGEGQSYTV